VSHFMANFREKNGSGNEGKLGSVLGGTDRRKEENALPYLLKADRGKMPLDTGGKKSMAMRQG